MLATPAQADGELAKITSSGELHIGYIPSQGTTTKDQVSGGVTGFYVDMIKAIVAQINVKPVFVETTWDNFIAGLQSNQFGLSTGAYVCDREAGPWRWISPNRCFTWAAARSLELTIHVFGHK